VAQIHQILSKLPGFELLDAIAIHHGPILYTTPWSISGDGKAATTRLNGVNLSDRDVFFGSSFRFTLDVDPGKGGFHTVYDMKISIQQNLRYYCNYYPKVDIFQDFPTKLHIFIYGTSKAKGLHFAEICVVAEEPLTRDAYFTFIGLVVVLLGFAIYQLSPNSTSFWKMILETC